MDMSAAALPPRQPYISETDRKHPLFGEYQIYRNSCTRLMINADSMQNWLSARECSKRGDEIRADPRYPEFLRWMWANQGGARKPPHGLSCWNAWTAGHRW